MPTAFQQDLCIAGYLPRAKPTDVLVRRSDCPVFSTVATSSPRRRAQLALLQGELEWTTLRGNVGTRLRKIAEDHQADATLLASAGLERLAIDSYPGLEFSELSLQQMVPAPGQAAIAIQCREADLETYQDLFCEATKLAVTFEREFLHRLGGGCQTPVGAHYDGSTFYLFHPEVGHSTYEFELTDLLEIDGILTAILADLNLGGIAPHFLPRTCNHPLEKSI